MVKLADGSAASIPTVRTAIFALGALIELKWLVALGMATFAQQT